VLQHLLQHRGPPPSRVLLLTDGAVGTPDARAVRTLAERGTALHVGLVQRSGGGPRLPWAASVTRLPGG
jgi:hypothetical protein